MLLAQPKTLDEQIAYTRGIYRALAPDYYKTGEMKVLPEEWQNLPDQFDAALGKLKEAVLYLKKGIEERNQADASASTPQEARENETVKTLQNKRVAKEEFLEVYLPISDGFYKLLENATAADTYLAGHREGKIVTYGGGGGRLSREVARELMHACMHEHNVPIPDLGRE